MAISLMALKDRQKKKNFLRRLKPDLRVFKCRSYKLRTP